MKTYTLTETETAAYDSGDDVQANELMRALEWQFAGTGTEVYHPDGFVAFTYPPETVDTVATRELDCRECAARIAVRDCDRCPECDAAPSRYYTPELA